MGENVIPAAAGTYYYSLKSPASPSKTTLNVTSESQASVTVSDGCGYSYGAKNFPTLNFTMTPVNANTTKIFTVVKEEATAADESFTVAFDKLKPIEDDEQGEPIEIGMEPATYNTPGTGSLSTFYYSFTAPEGEPVLLSLTSSNAVSTGYSGPFKITKLGKRYDQLASGLTINAQTEPGQAYILSVEVPADTPDGFDFTVVYKELQPGSISTYPIEAVIGENNVPAFSPVYFTYTTEQDHYLLLKADLQEGGSLTVQSPGSWTGMITETLTEVDGGYKFEAKAGIVYSIQLTDAVADSKLTLEKLPYAEGESSQTAIEIEDGTRTIDAFPSKVWYKAVAPIDGFFKFSTTLTYSFENQIQIYVGAVDASHRKEVKYDYSAKTYNDFKCDVTEGDVVYLCIYNKVSPAAEFTVSFAEAQEGEIPSMAIPVKYEDPSTEFTIPVVTSGNSRWYSLELPEGQFSMNADTDQYITMQLYAPGNTTTVLAHASFIYASGGYGFSDVILSTPGKYLLCIEKNDVADLALVMTVTAPGPGDTPTTANELDLEAISYTMELPSTGNIASPNGCWYKFNVNPGELSIKGNANKYFNGFLFSGDDLNTPVAEITTKDFGEYEYRCGFYDVKVEKAGTYYMKIFNSTYEGTVLTFSGSAIVTPAAVVNVNATSGVNYAFSLPMNTGKVGVALAEIPENWEVVGATVNGEAVADSNNVAVEVAEENISVEFELAYSGTLGFLDETVGVLAIDTKITMEIVDGAIVIKNTTVGDEIKVYNLGGMLMDQHTAQNTQVRITLDKGTYIVTVNQNAVKVVL